ncbi:Nucleoporin GLE1 [Armadillidium nasatum]|uniref:mRNA export factor GLE1 n=1 Tax=Armadillidium nasatum TaxID=96803 RepID=A0A5N5SJH0_9CRUS|nr:Nucleoporin GLE1 [Armadillidium nasatum]
MSYSAKKLSSLKLLQNKLSKSNSLSPKSVTAYIKELDKEAKQDIKKLSNLDEDNPANLKNVSPSDEICDFKNVGDLSNISFSPNNSFFEVVSEEEEKDDENEVIDAANEEKLLFPLDLEKEEEEGDEDDDVFVSLNNLSIELVMNEIQLEKERIHMSQTEFNKLKNEYLQNLSRIRESACEQLLQLRLEEKTNQEIEQERLEERKKADSEEILKAEQEYMREVEIKREEILKEVEALTVEEEKRKLHNQELIDKLHEDVKALEVKLGSIQVEARDLGCGEDLIKIVFEELPSIYEVTKKDLSKLNRFSSKGEGIAAISRRLEEGFKILDNIQRLLDTRKEQRVANKGNSEQVEATSPVSQQFPESSAPPPEYDTHKSKSVSKGNEAVTDRAQSPSHISVSKESNPILREAENFYLSLKAKFNSISEAANETRENANLRPLLSRAVGIINTLSNEKYDSSNKGKLQQLLNLLNGRPCTIGSDYVSTQNNASAQAFVKEQLAIRIISLGHDKQVATMGIYASLVVRIWQLYPEVGELILFKLYETCPFLVPLPVRRYPSQTDEEFNRSIGIRHKEGGIQEPVDKYLTRMGAAAQFYGRIISVQVENHPHGIQEGWKWIARTLSMPPQPSITASLLSGFLSTAGAPLLNQYGKQFTKLLQFICIIYLPEIERDVLEGGQSDIVSLKVLLEQYQQTNSLPQVIN